MAESTGFNRYKSQSGGEFLSLPVLVPNARPPSKWVEFKPMAQNLAMLFTPHGEPCPNAPFKIRVDERTYVGTGEHSSRLICAPEGRAALEGAALEERGREYPQFRTMRPPPNQAGELGEYLVKGLTLAQFRDELFDVPHDPKTACWITDLEFETESSLSFLLHYRSINQPHYYEAEPETRLPDDARMSVRMFFLAII